MMIPKRKTRKTRKPKPKPKPAAYIGTDEKGRRIVRIGPMIIPRSG